MLSWKSGFMTFKQPHYFILVSLISLILAGCGGGSDRPSLAPASGIVTLNDEPVEGASLTFVPVAGGRPGSAITDAQGRYTIKTYQDAPGAIIGEHKVAVIKISGPGVYAIQGDAPAKPPASEGADDGSDSLSEIAVFDSAEAKEPEIIYDVPQKYMNANESGLLVTVPPEGSSELHLQLVK
jgi:hypothetical protein